MDWNIFIDPLRNLITVVFEYLPRVVSALVLLVVAWILAKILRSIIRRALRASKVDKMLGKGGDAEDEKQFPIAQGAGTAAFWLVWLFFGLAILQVFGMQGILDSVVVIFEEIFAVVPNIIGALVILLIFYWIARLLARLITKFLTSVHFNEIPVKLGLTKQTAVGIWTPADIVGYIVLVLVMLFAIMMAADILGFAVVSELISQFTEFFSLVLLGVIVLAVGIFLANLAGSAIRAGGRSPALASAVRIFIMVLVVALALRTMGFANDIILLGFGLMLGAFAFAAAIAFGFGGRDTASYLLSRWIRSQKSDDTHNS